MGGVPTVLLSALRLANTGLEVVVATSDHPDDDLIVNALESSGIDVRRGSQDDALSRFAAATVDLEPDDIVLRFTADNTFPDGRLASELIKEVENGKAYVRVGGAHQEGVPYGVSGEAFLVSTLRAADAGATSPFEREHVTPWISAHFGDEVLQPEETDGAWTDLSCTVDTYADYVRVARVFASSTNPVSADWRELTRDLLSFQRPRIPPVPLKKVGNPHCQSNVILGTAQLSSTRYGAVNEREPLTTAEATDLIATAAACGITHLDTARAYSGSEEKIGTANHSGQFPPLKVVTKLQPLTELYSKATSRNLANIARLSTLASCFSLRAKRLDVLLVHRATDWSLPGVRAELLRLQREGILGALGASVDEPSQLLSLLEDEQIAYVQFPYNVLDWRWREAHVQEAIQSRPDVTFTARSVFLQGLLANRSESKWPQNFDCSPRELYETLHLLARTFDRQSVTDLCLAYVLAHDWITSAVLGAETPDQILEFAELARARPLTREQVKLTEEALPHVSVTSLNPAKWKWSPDESF